ncbi:MAG TPA: WcaF family extracellular polysaccharide biosynthesis acetyltransferase [Daejeonella sp.]|nr:WcaF family extracellular polysaccharide biosynthesis acetyltransferase [Daejeonella sp.]
MNAQSCLQEPLKQISLKKKFDKKDYHPGASSLKIVIWYFVSALFIRSGFIPFSTIIVWILKIFGAKIGRDVRIKPFVNIKYPWKLHMGDHSWIGEHCWIENLAEVKLGKNVCLSQGCMLLTGNHNYQKTTFDLFVKPIEIENGAWIGARAVVSPGVRVASHAVLSLASVATKNLDPYSVYQGNPAIKIRDRVIS